MTWLKKIGWTGPSRFVAMGRTLVGSYGGCAIVRTYWMISSICRSLSCGLNGGMSEESPTDCGPSEMARCRNSLGSGFITAPTVRSWGLMARLAPLVHRPCPTPHGMRRSTAQTCAERAGEPPRVQWRNAPQRRDRWPAAGWRRERCACARPPAPWEPRGRRPTRSASCWPSSWLPSSAGRPTTR
jgi:hypothetical protein